MIRKAISAFVAFMLGVTFAAVSASFHHRPEVHAVSFTVSGKYEQDKQDMTSSPEVKFVCTDAGGCEYQEKAGRWDKDSGSLINWERKFTNTYRTTEILYKNSTVDFSELFKAELEEQVYGNHDDLGNPVPRDYFNVYWVEIGQVQVITE